MEEAKKQLIEAAEAAQPKTEAEAILSQGGIPSNTADLLKQRETSETADRAVHEGTQGTVGFLTSPLAFAFCMDVVLGKIGGRCFDEHLQASAWE